MTTYALRKQIEVVEFFENDGIIAIHYQKNGEPRFLPVDKVENTELMELIDGQVCQFDAINLVVAHEMNLANQKVLNITKPDTLFEDICGIVRTHNAAYIH